MNSISVYADGDDYSEPYRFTIDFLAPQNVLDGIERYFENGQFLPDSLISYIENEFDIKPEDKSVHEKFMQKKYSLVPNHVFIPSKRPGIFYLRSMDKMKFDFLFLVPYDSDNLDDFYTEVSAPMVKSARKRGPSIKRALSDDEEDDAPYTKRARTAAARLLQRHNGDIEAAAQMLAKNYF